jgi:hypothetical protein
MVDKSGFDVNRDKAARHLRYPLDLVQRQSIRYDCYLWPGSSSVHKNENLAVTPFNLYWIDWKDVGGVRNKSN